MSKQGTLTAGRPSVTKNRAATLASLADDATMKRVNFDLPADQHTKLKIYATKQGKTIKELLTEYVAQLPE
jgi:hypothetical protein